MAIWAQTETALAADLGSGLDDPRATASELLGRALAGLPSRIDRARVRMRVDAGYFAAKLACAADAEGIGFAIGAKRVAPLWRLLDGIAAIPRHLPRRPMTTRPPTAPETETRYPNSEPGATGHQTCPPPKP